MSCGLAAGSGVPQIEPPFDANQTLGETIGGDLLLGVGCCQVAEMLDDRGLSTFEISKATLDFAERALDIREVGADRAKLRRHDVFGTLDHTYFYHAASDVESNQREQS